MIRTLVTCNVIAIILVTSADAVKKKFLRKIIFCSTTYLKMQKFEEKGFPFEENIKILHAYEVNNFL